MAIRAENDPKFSRRFLYMGIAALFFSLYCLYDGLIGYPHVREQAFAYFRQNNKLFELNPTLNKVESLSEFEAKADKDQRKRWEDYLHETGKPSHGDVMMQFAMAGATAVAGLWLISIPLRARGRWIEFDGLTMTSSWGQSFTPEQVVSINKCKWRNKGIAKVVYDNGGRKQTFVLDDYKFDRYLTDDILYELEQRIDPALITGGPPEPPPEEVQQGYDETTPVSEHVESTDASQG